MEEPDSDSVPTATEVSTSALPPPLHSRVIMIGEGEIHHLKNHLKGLSTSTSNLEKHLEALCCPLVELSEKEDPSITAKCWMEQVRELCYDTGDYLHDFTHSCKEFDILDARARNASERLETFGLRPKTPSTTMVRRVPTPHADLIHDVHKDMADKVEHLMGTVKELKVVSIVGPEGVGKTTLAKELYRRCLGSIGELHCWAFLRVSANPDITKLLTSMYTQILRKQPSGQLHAYELTEIIARHLQNKRYIIIIDDLWTSDVWDIIRPAFPDGDCCSRIITTTQFMDVALACCGHQSKYVFKMLPLSDVQSRKLFFGIVFGSESQNRSGSKSDCPGDLVDVSNGIIRKCGGLPLATIYIASMLPISLNLVHWTGIRDSLPSTWSTNPTSEWMKEVVNLMFNTLKPHLKTCLLYFSMYPEGYILRKDDLVKQWLVEGFLDAVEGQATEEIAGGYFDELVRRGMIQPVGTKNGEVLSCTLHHTVYDVILNKSMEQNFIITVDHFQSSIPLADKVRRLSVQFGDARSAHIPESIMALEIRSLAFFGFILCFLSISVDKYRNLRVLILHISADEDKDSFDLTGIHELLRLRYMKIACNIAVKLPDKIQRQQYLETLEVSTVTAIPSDIGELRELRMLKISVMKLSRKDIYSLKILPALTALWVHVKVAPTNLVFFGKGGFSVLEFFKFRCSAPRLLIEKKAMPKIEKLNICFNAHQARQYGKKPITIRYLPSLREISVKIGGAVPDAGSALVDAVTNHPRNPNPKLMESSEDQEQRTLEEQYDILEEDTHEYPGTREEGSGECENTEADLDETQDDGSGEEDYKDAESWISMPTVPSTPLTVPVGWGIATAGWILSPVFTRLVDKALSHMEPGKLNDTTVGKLAAHVIPRLKLMVEGAESSKDMVFFEELVRKLKSYFYELEEALDEVEYARLDSQLTGSSYQEIFFESSRKLPESVTNRLTEILKKIEQALEVARDKIKREKLQSNIRSTSRPKTTSGQPRVRVIGRDVHLEKIIQLLHNTNYCFDPMVTRPLSVIGIYGISGSGKTTLAHHVYQYEKNANHFEHFMWIHVSRNFSVRDIFREMLKQGRYDSNRYSRNYSHMYTEKLLNDGVPSLEIMRAELKEVFRGERLLLVLDDIWCDKDSDKYKLYDLFSVLPKDYYKTSQILVTSRNKMAISAIGHYMKDAAIEIHDLSEKDFFQLFMNHALGVNMTDVIVKESLKAIGADIAKRLKGSPLAAALVGGLLRREMTVDHWMSVNDDPYLLKGIMGILWLCFKHLHEPVRRCFAYCSIFPRRHRFERDDLVNLWVAEGLIEAKDARQMEAIGNDYFGELVATSFMQLGEKDSNGGKEYFVVHDLLRDIAEQVGGNDFFRIEDGWRGEVPLDVRHLFVQTSYRFLMKDVIKLEKLRSLIIVTGENTIGDEVVTDILGNEIRLWKLRVLVVNTAARGSPHSYNHYSLPESIGDLKHIRYLAFRVGLSNAIDIPDAFTKLYHMQVLDFGDCSQFVTGGDMRMLTNLRQLMVRGELGAVGSLASLENLPFFHISKDSGCELSQLSGLHKLRGKLQIVGLEKVKSMDKALTAKLADKDGLKELVLEWGYFGYKDTRVTEKVQADVLVGLCPSEHLEELGLTGYQGDRYPNWMVVDQNRPWSVRRLALQNCSPLVTGSSSFFANLLRLTFKECKGKALTDHMEHLRKLTVLIIYQCYEIELLGELPQSLKYLEICRCDERFMQSYEHDADWNEKTKGIGRKFIGYPRLQDSSEYPDEHGVFSSDTSLHAKKSQTSTPLPPGRQGGTVVGWA